MIPNLYRLIARFLTSTTIVDETVCWADARFRKLNLACSSAFLQGLYNTMPKNKTKIQDNKILTQSNQSLSVSLHCIRASDKLAHPNNSKNSVTGWTFVNPRRQPPPNLTRSWYGMPPHWPPLMPYSNIY